MKTKIIAIGGGEIGRPGTEIETLAIDKKIIKEAKGKNVLFLPTAMNDDKLYQETIKKLLADKLGCYVDYLLCCNNCESEETIEKKIKKADIIYVGAGNTAKMLNIWKTKNIDTHLKRALEKGTMLCGLSAGAVCWFDEIMTTTDGEYGGKMLPY